MKKVQFRRKQEYKTDYKARIALLKSALPRLVIRKTERYMIAQIIKSKEAQDFVLCSVNSAELKKYDWNFSCKNLPACYLSGLLVAKKAAEKKIKECVLDAGMQRSTKGSRIYALVKGAIDGGMKITCSEEIFPSEERIAGKHINAEIVKKFSELKEKLKK